MVSDSPCLILADAIENELCRDITVSAEIMRYVTSVSGANTLDDIRRALQNDTSGEGASLLELILFPDEGFQAAIEGIVESCSFCKSDETTIRDLLILRRLSTVLHFPGLGSLPVAISEETISPVIARLNIARKTDTRIIEALHCFSEEPIRTRCKILLRNSRWIQSEAHVRLLQKAIQKPIPENENFIEFLSVLLEFLTDFHPQSDIKQALESEKERLIHLLDMADRQDYLLRTSPMETIMLQGVRIISIDREKIITRIHVLEDVLQMR